MIIQEENNEDVNIHRGGQNVDEEPEFNDDEELDEDQNE